MLAVASGRPGWQIGVVVVSVLCGQLSVGWSNDALDASRDRAAGRVDKPIVVGDATRRAVAVAAVVSGVLAVAVSLLLGATGWLHVIALVGAWSYNEPLKRTVWSVVPYAVSFGLLVAYAHPGAGGALVAAGALLGSAAHFVNVLPDLDADAATGVRGLPHRLGARASVVIAMVLLVAAAVAVSLPLGPVGLAVPVATVGWPVVARRIGVSLFRAVQVVALLDVALLVVTVTW